MKPSKYNICLPYEDRFVIFNGITKRFFIVSRENREAFLKIISAPNIFINQYGYFIKRIIDEGFIIDDDVEEFEIIRKHYDKRNQDGFYKLMILPTYDCNVSCWYCIQDHRNLKLSDESAEKIKKHIEFYLAKYNIRKLQLAWFGGEPLLNFRRIDEIATFAKDYCEKIKIKCHNTIVTNGILLNRRLLERMKDLNFTFFQITIDGTKKEHDQTKTIKNKSAYDVTLRNICLIAEILPDSEISLRYNYTAANLYPEQIVNDLAHYLPENIRSQITISLKKVWQEDDEVIDQNKLSEFKSQAFNNHFDIDCKKEFGCCYVDHKHFNCIFPNGRVGKCDNIDPNSAGGIILDNGEIFWENENHYIHYTVFDDTSCQCVNCNYLPLCYGPCPMERESAYMKEEKLKCRFGDPDKHWQQKIISYCQAFLILLMVILPCSAFAQGDSARVAVRDTLARPDSTIHLRDITVTGRNVVSYADRDVWTITRDMRRNTYDTYSLLNKIPGFIYDEMTGRLSYWGKTNILITIDGRDKGSGLGGSLANMRFKKIEIYDHPEGRYADYDVVVNLITYEHWEGYDVRMNGMARVLPSGHNFLSDFFPDIYYTYTRPKIDLSVRYNYNSHRLATDQELSLTENREVRYTSFEYDQPSNDVHNQAHTGWVDFDYKPSKEHTFSAKYSLSLNKTDQESNYLMSKTDLTNQYDTRILRHRDNDFSTRENILSLFYQYQKEKWLINAEATFNRYDEKRDYMYSESGGYSTKNRYENARNAYHFSADAMKALSEASSLSFGFLSQYRKYEAEELFSHATDESSFYRHRLYANYSNRFSSKIAGSIGGVLEYLKTTSSELEDGNQIVWSGNASIRYGRYGDNFYANLYYRSNTRYPTLYQMTALGNSADSLVYYTGNPDLRSETTHRIDLSLRFHGFGINPVITYSSNTIANVFKNRGNSIYNTYDNIETLNYRLVFGYYPKTIKFKRSELFVKAEVYHGGYVSYFPEEKLHVSYWGGEAQLVYSSDKHESVKLDYRKLSTKTLSGQTITQNGNDGWFIQLSKSSKNMRFRISLEYKLPISIGISRTAYSNISTPLYQMYTCHDEYAMTKNSIRLSVFYQLAKGHQVRKRDHQQTHEVELYNEYY